MVALGVVAVLWVVVFVAVPFAMRRMAAADGRLNHAAGSTTATKALLDGSAIPVQIIFAETSSDDVRVDCLLMAPLGSRDAGFPFTVRVQRPENAALDATMVSTLESMADDLAEAKLRFLISNGDPRVRIATRHSAMMFNLAHGAKPVA
jgi:hypothetical protein